MSEDIYQEGRNYVEQKQSMIDRGYELLPFEMEITREELFLEGGQDYQ